MAFQVVGPFSNPTRLLGQRPRFIPCIGWHESAHKPRQTVEVLALGMGQHRASQEPLIAATPTRESAPTRAMSYLVKRIRG